MENQMQVVLKIKGNKYKTISHEERSPQIRLVIWIVYPNKNKLSLHCWLHRMFYYSVNNQRTESQHCEISQLGRQKKTSHFPNWD